MAGQVEWLQYAPKGRSLNIIVVNKSDFGGSFRMAVRPMFGTQPAVRPIKWQNIDIKTMGQLLAGSRSTLPLIDGELAATYVLEPKRTVKSYSFGAKALAPGLNFALAVRFDPDMPPLFVQAGGIDTRSAEFKWISENGFVEIDNSGTKYADTRGMGRSKFRLSDMAVRAGSALLTKTTPLPLCRSRRTNRFPEK